MVEVLLRLQAFLVKKIRIFLSRIRYLSLHRGSRVNIVVIGSFLHGKRCVISEGVNILVPKNSSLLLGDDSFIGRYVELGPLGHIKIDNGTSLQDRCIIVGDVKIGQNCLLSLNVLITSGKHYYDLFPSWLIKDQDLYVQNTPSYKSAHSRQVVIEDDCWLGVNTVVMPGVTIGKGAIVGANSVVTRDVEPYTVVVGTPAVIVKKRLKFMPPEVIDYQNENDWPYFYSGFDSRKRSIKTSIGMRVNKLKFVITLSCRVGDIAVINIKKIGNSFCIISHKNQNVELVEGLNEILITIDNDSKNQIHFEVNKIDKRQEIFVLNAHIKNLDK